MYFFQDPAFLALFWDRTVFGQLPAWHHPLPAVFRGSCRSTKTTATYKVEELRVSDSQADRIRLCNTPVVDSLIFMVRKSDFSSRWDLKSESVCCPVTEAEEKMNHFTCICSFLG